ncbi:MAG: 50S ribosomal protein L7ae [Clostridiales bacterium]|nr:50S ribosomal protein L7ae [Clostridiales bacterium]
MRAINDKIFQLIGLSKRAGKLVSGAYTVEQSIKSGKAQLVIISQDASLNTMKKFTEMCRHRKIDIIKLGSKQDLGQSIGKPARTLLAITDLSFKDLILNELALTTKNMGVIE